MTTTRATGSFGAGQARTRGSGASSVFETLRRDILDMRLLPGEPLDEARLSTRFNLSRTPVREALVRLMSEGLATTLPNRNTIVANIDFASVPSYLDALMLMYRVTCRLAALRRTPQDIEVLRRLQGLFAQAVASTNAVEMILVNRDFHVAIARAGRNEYYTEFFARLLDTGQRLLRIYYSSYSDKLPQEYVEEHDAIITAIALGDEDTADRLGAEHARQVVVQIQSFVGSGVGRQIALGLAVAQPTTPPAGR